MTSSQRVIKYAATGFAIFLIVSIFSLIIAGITSLAGVFGLIDDKSVSKDLKTIEISNQNISDIDINLASSSFTVKIGDKFLVETNNDEVTVDDKNGLKVKEKSHIWNFKKDSKVVLYIPNTLIDSFKVDSGAGRVYIESLKANTLSLDLGAGEVTIDNLVVNNKATIKGGAGKISVKDGSINNLKLDIGVGDASITSALTGKSDIDSGIGSLDIDIIGRKSHYSIEASKGIGSIKVDGKNVKDNETVGNGANYIKLNGGIGSIKVNFK